MKRLTLKRIAINETGTYGVLVYNNTPFAVTAEREDLCNMINESCIPCGSYICKRVDSPKHGDCFEITNVPGRTNIQFHTGNIPRDDSEGCVLVGRHFDYLYGNQAIIDSVSGYNKLMKLLVGDIFFHLTIINC